MDEYRYILPSNIYLSQKTPSDRGKPRLPLGDSKGNAHYPIVATTSTYNDQKALQPRPPSDFLLPTLPSQPARQHSQLTALEARRCHIRSQRAQKGSKHNPIIESEHYQAYRSRQIKGDDGEQKWPEDIEDLFLEALCLLPYMGRRYCESLQPGQSPDPSRQRTRKQVSSHIQVLKGFMRGHPAFGRLFPPKDALRNGYEDSFKIDPCLRALAQGHLPRRQNNFDPSIGIQPPYHLQSSTQNFSLSPHEVVQSTSESAQGLRPSIFKMYMTTLRPGVEFKDVPGDDTGNGKLSTRVHTYSDSVPRALGHSLLDTLPNWRTRFPILSRLHSQNDLDCDIIHIHASLELRYGSLPERSELWGKFELLIPGKHSQQSVWSCTQSLFKPADLYGCPISDPKFENITSTPHIDRYEPGVGTHIRVSFPASPWAYALQRLSSMEAQFDSATQTGSTLLHPTINATARQYISQITMFQEIFCSPAPNQPFSRQAILLWTFEKCRAGERGLATWRYLDALPLPFPSRGNYFSLHPGDTRPTSDAISDSFAAWADSGGVGGSGGIPSSSLLVPPLMATTPNFFEPLPPSNFDDLTIPLGDGPLQFSSNYAYPSAENLNFMSQATMAHDGSDSASLLDLHRHQHHVGMDNFLAGPTSMLGGSSSGGCEGGFDHEAAGGAGGVWEAPPIQSLDTDPAFLTSYVGSTVGPGWDGVKHDTWGTGVDVATLGGFEGHVVSGAGAGTGT